MMTLAKAAAMVTAEARARAWWRQQRAVGHHPDVVVDGGGKDLIAPPPSTAAAVDNDRHCLAFGGRCHRLWQWR